MPLLILFAQGTFAPALNVGEAIAALPPQLGAAGMPDLVYWTEAELYRFADEAAQRLARRAGGFVVRDTTIAIIPNQAVYDLPPRHLSTIHVSNDFQALRESNAYELEARDSEWLARTDTDPKRFLHDGEGMKKVRLWPQPTIGGAPVGIIHHEYPATLRPGSAGIQAPTVMEAYFAMAVLGEATAKESKGAKPEVAQWARGMVEILDSAIEGYWGRAE